MRRAHRVIPQPAVCFCPLSAVLRLPANPESSGLCAAERRAFQERLPVPALAWPSVRDKLPAYTRVCSAAATPGRPVHGMGRRAAAPQTRLRPRPAKRAAVRAAHGPGARAPSRAWRRAGADGCAGGVQLIVMALCSATWLAITIAVFVGNHQRPTAVWEGYRDPIAWAVLLWPAIGARLP
jgi:hypothetical protein